MRTTGIFCRPTCPAKSRRAKTSTSSATPSEALLGGYPARPLKQAAASIAIQATTQH
ncbi:MAG: hypothetical protein H0X34_09665 [Chthoniobacterales bacterium]|nr:hypothetical protein [Chthoniobacterales bacterium]